MFYTLSLTAPDGDCTELFGSRALCTVRDSYVTLYLLFLGTPLIDTDSGAEDNLSTGLVVLIVAFLALLLFLVLNLMVLIVVEATKLDMHEVALDSYWGRLLTFLYAVWDLTSCFARRRHTLHSSPMGKWATRAAVSRPPVKELNYSSLENRWNYNVLSVLGADTKRTNLWYLDCEGASESQVALFFRRIASVLVLAMWTAAGFLTCGLLWPPQIRRWMFRTVKSRNGSRDNLESSTLISGVRCELLQLKLMSYGKLSDVQRDIRELHELLRAAVGD